MTDSCGIVYIATGERFIEEFRESVRSVNDVMPSVPVVLFTDEDVESPYVDDVRIIDDPRYDYLDKAAHLADTPFDCTLFLDTDTYVTDDVSELFTILDEHDVSAAHAPLGISTELDVPESYPEFNTGVIAYRQTEAVREMISTWYEIGDGGTRYATRPAVIPESRLRERPPGSNVTNTV
ncbi:hypothetical protein OB919_20955 [Halobacteria archaeon AArc-curdl1]|uniref:Nucleotide-diphospho-sugar transferase n=1 Tax=Natronosalvus hydrolyticus TaxID=2979988 RepID=A0AAP2ZBV9_9EURY|nr:hypothetical protein [Halobacteria archaeon AArc-curdl1]